MPSLLIVGAATRDIVPGEGRGWRLGGGVAYGAMAAARLGVRVRALIGLDDEAASAPELESLRNAGVEIRRAPLDRGPVMENRETDAGRLQLVEQASDPLTVEALPAEWRDGPAVLLAPVAGELGPEWATALPAESLVGLAWQGLLRRLEPGQPIARLSVRPSQLTERADVALVSADDVGRGAQPISALLGRDRQRLVISHGVLGALHVARSAGLLRWQYVPPLPPRRPVDSTGAGDVFLAAWFATLVAVRAGGGTAEGSGPLSIAAVAASLSVTRSGVDGLPDLREICRELRARPAGLGRPHA